MGPKWKMICFPYKWSSMTPSFMHCHTDWSICHTDWSTLWVLLFLHPFQFMPIGLMNKVDIMSGTQHFLPLKFLSDHLHSIQFSSVARSCLTLCHPMNHSTPGLPVHHQLLEFTQTHVHRVGDAIQPSHPLSSPSPVPNPSQNQGLFKWVNSSHKVAKVLEFQL